jgi:predicted glutamine amidotransferase
MCDILVANGRHPLNANKELNKAVPTFWQRKGPANDNGTSITFRDEGQSTILKDVRQVKESPIGKWGPKSEKKCILSLVMHLRKASQGDINPNNTQPFIDELGCFAHNGDIGPGIDNYPRTAEHIVAYEEGKKPSDSVKLWGALKLFLINLKELGIFGSDYYNCIHTFYYKVNGITLEDNKEKQSRIIGVFDTGETVWVYQNRNPWKVIFAQDISNGSPAVLLHTSSTDDSIKSLLESSSPMRQAYGEIMSKDEYAKKPLLEDCKMEKMSNGEFRVYQNGELTYSAPQPDLVKAAMCLPSDSLAYSILFKL